MSLEQRGRISTTKIWVNFPPVELHVQPGEGQKNKAQKNASLTKILAVGRRKEIYSAQTCSAFNAQFMQTDYENKYSCNYRQF